MYVDVYIGGDENPTPPKLHDVMYCRIYVEERLDCFVSLKALILR